MWTKPYRYRLSIPFKQLKGVLHQFLELPYCPPLLKINEKNCTQPLQRCPGGPCDAAANHCPGGLCDAAANHGPQQAHAIRDPCSSDWLMVMWVIYMWHHWWGTGGKYSNGEVGEYCFKNKKLGQWGVVSEFYKLMENRVKVILTIIVWCKRTKEIKNLKVSYHLSGSKIEKIRSRWHGGLQCGKHADFAWNPRVLGAKNAQNWLTCHLFPSVFHVDFTCFFQHGKKSAVWTAP